MTTKWYRKLNHMNCRSHWNYRVLSFPNCEAFFYGQTCAVYWEWRWKFRPFVVVFLFKYLALFKVLRTSLKNFILQPNGNCMVITCKKLRWFQKSSQKCAIANKIESNSYCLNIFLKYNQFFKICSFCS